MADFRQRTPISSGLLLAAAATLIMVILSPARAENWHRFAPLYPGDGATCIDLDSIRSDKDIVYFAFYDIGSTESCESARNVWVIKVAISCQLMLFASRTTGDYTPIKYHVLYPNSRNWQLMDVGPNKEFGARVLFVCRR